MNYFSLVLLILGIIFFMAGMHMIDNAWNMEYIQSTTGTVLFDQSYFIQNYSGGELYRLGIMVTFAGFLLSVLGAVTITKELHLRKSKLPDVYEDP